MTTYNTGNPVPSADPRDRYDNSQAFDEAITGQELTFTDRLGVERKSWAGLEQQFADFMVSQGWEAVTVPYAAGAVVERPTQLVEREGELYRVALQSLLPLTLSGTWETDAPTLVAVGNQALRDLLASPVGASMIGRNDTTVDAALGSLEDGLALVEDDLTAFPAVIPPSLPAITPQSKLIMTSGGVTYIVTRKANGRRGYAAMTIGNTVAAADAQNIGGASPWRLQEVQHISRVYVAKSGISSKTAGVLLSSVAQTVKDTMWGYQSGAAAEYYSTSLGSSPEVNIQTRGVYEIPASNSVTYLTSGSFATVRLGLTGGSSADCRVEVSTDNAAWQTAATVNLALSASGSGKIDVRVSSPSDTANWYVRVRNNAASGLVYVVGLNVGALDRTDASQEIDNALVQRVTAVEGLVNAWLDGTGANEFAAKTVAGVWHGTYHGGHSEFLQRLRTESANHNLDSSAPPALAMTSSVQLFTASTLTVGASEYGYTAITQFGDGAAITQYNVELKAGAPALFADVYTHMATTSSTFDYVHAPAFFRKTDDGDVDIGQCSFIQQFRSADALTLNTYFSQINLNENVKRGAYVRFTTNYNKQYYGPALGSAGFDGIAGSYVTAKEFF